jgi:hypothetical protein
MEGIIKDTNNDNENYIIHDEIYPKTVIFFVPSLST